jgi:DNA-binding MarR family transcriptional regulator
MTTVQVDASTKVSYFRLSRQLLLVRVASAMPSELLSPQELRVWQAFRLMGEDVLSRIGRDLAGATGLSGPEFGVLSRLAVDKGEIRQQALAECLGWDKSRLSHQLTRMEERGLIKRRGLDKRLVLVQLTALGRKTLEAARPVHAESVRRNLLSRLTAEQIATIVRVSNILGDDD